MRRNNTVQQSSATQVPPPAPHRSRGVSNLLVVVGNGEDEEEADEKYNSEKDDRFFRKRCRYYYYYGRWPNNNILACAVVSCTCIAMVILYFAVTNSLVEFGLGLYSHPSLLVTYFRSYLRNPYDAIDEDYDDPSHEFPYPRSCPPNILQSGVVINPTIHDTDGHENLKYSIVLAYHVGMVKNWKLIVKDQLQTLDRCGLGHAANHLILSFSNGNSSDEVLQLMKPFNFSFQESIQLVKATTPPWEGHAMDAVHDFCQRSYNNKIPQDKNEPTIVFYFHNKGASRWTEDWRETKQVNTGLSYARALYWRKYMEYFLIERPSICIDHIVRRGVSTCGPNLDWAHYRKHYSGNFWSASCEYIVSLQSIKSSTRWYESGYYSSEMWIGQGFTDAHRDKFVDQFSVEFTPLEYLLTPEMYSDGNKTHGDVF